MTKLSLLGDMSPRVRAGSCPSSPKGVARWLALDWVVLTQFPVEMTKNTVLNRYFTVGKRRFPVAEWHLLAGKRLLTVGKWRFGVVFLVFWGVKWWVAVAGLR